jgi:dUTP pyrophosphatase
LAAKHGITVLNSPGTIDNGYTGELKVILINHGRDWFFGVKGDRIAQLYIEQIPQLEFGFAQAIAPSDRSEGGFGSTGS